MRLHVVLGVAALTLLTHCNATADSRKGRSFRGRVVAYRPADRMQVASFAANKELLLFQVNASRQQILKLVYTHYGYSLMKGDILSGRRAISAFVVRDQTCDESLESFEKEAPAIPLQGKSSVSTERVVFSRHASLPPRLYRMSCYVLERWAPLTQNHQ